MTNLEYLRMMSAEQITKWLYEWWIPRGQYAWNSSSGALTMLLNKEYGDIETEMLFGDSSAEPIVVIQSRTLMPTKDFKEWAKRIREVNPNAVIIPCDAEVASAEAEQLEWVVDEYGIYHCPVCHAINNTVYKNYCPNCGARMKGGGTICE